MTDTIKVLGQLDATAVVEEELYTVPDVTVATISTIAVCNRTASPITFRLSVSVNDVATTNKDYLFYDAALAANSTMTATLGLTLGQNDTIRTFTSANGMSFNLFGVETS